MVRRALYAHGDYDERADEFGTEQYSDEPGYAADYDNIHEPGEDDGDESYGYE